MLVVDNRIESDEGITSHRSFNIDEFIWPHGLTPPLHHVRKRRFRRRVNKRVRLAGVESDITHPSTYPFRP